MTSPAEERLILEKSLAIERARKGLLAFILETKPDFEVNWHHRAICRAINYMQMGATPRELLATWGIKGKRLEQMLANPHPVTKLYAGCTRPDAIDEPINGLQICVQPRAGKSEIVSRRTPPWLFGKNPDAQLISVSYSSDLSSRMNRDTQRVIDDPHYAAVFPDTRLNSSNVRSSSHGSYLRNSDIYEIVGHRGVYRSAGVGGGITGMGATTAIIDDALRNRADADSPTIRENIWDWYASTLYTRLEKKATKLICNTRWHEADISGKTLSQAMADPDVDQWFCLTFPAVLDCDPGPGDPRKHGEVLWPGKFDAKRMQRIKATVGSYEWESLYQQRPTRRGGGIIKEAWWKYYTRLPDNLTNWVISADLSFTDRGDYSPFQVWACRGAERYLVHELRARMSFMDQIKAMESMTLKYRRATAKLVEEAANGAALIDALKKRIPGIIPIKVHGRSKELRVDAITPLLEAGNVFLPSPEIAPWINDWVGEMSAFPSGAFDDRVDAMSQALSYLEKRKFDVTAGMPITVGDRSHLAQNIR